MKTLFHIHHERLTQVALNDWALNRTAINEEVYLNKVLNKSMNMQNIGVVNFPHLRTIIFYGHLALRKQDGRKEVHCTVSYINIFVNILSTMNKFRSTGNKFR